MSAQCLKTNHAVIALAWLPRTNCQTRLLVEGGGPVVKPSRSMSLDDLMIVLSLLVKQNGLQLSPASDSSAV